MHSQARYLTYDSQETSHLKPIPPVNQGTSDRLGIGIDVALVTLVFLGVGYLLDRWLDTKPIFMVVLVVVGLIGEFVRFWYAYTARMKVLEAERTAKGRGEPYKDWKDGE